MARIQTLQLGVIGLATALSSACASGWPEQPGLPPSSSAVPAPYGNAQQAPRPAFEFERQAQYQVGPTFRDDRVSTAEEERTAERLADFQRNTAMPRMENAPLPRYQQRVASRVVEPVPAASTQQAQPLPPPPGFSDPAVGSVAAVPPMPQARPGECFALVRRPEQYRSVPQQIVSRPAYERMQVQPAQYQRSREMVTVQDAYERMEIVPATFKTVREQVMVRPATTRYVTTEPEYETVSEKIMVRPARQVWKKGRGPIERIDHATGDIMCLVEEPAQYKTITRRVLRRPAEAREVQVPAEYRTVTRRVIDQPAQVRRVTIPAETRQVEVQRMVAPPRVERIQVPAEYQTVQVRELSAPAMLEWRPVLCETNMSPDMIRSIQTALKRRGFDPGAIDGVLGRQTMEAVNAYQRANNLPVDRYLNMDTVRHLGVWSS